MIGYVLAVFALICSLAHLANKYQARWQARRDEELLIENAANFTTAWGQAEYRADEAFEKVTSDANFLADHQRKLAAQRIAAEEAVSDEACIALVVDSIAESAANGLLRPLEPALAPSTRIDQDKKMFAIVEREKWTKGILPLNEDGIHWSDGGIPKRRNG